MAVPTATNYSTATNDFLDKRFRICLRNKMYAPKNLEELLEYYRRADNSDAEARAIIDEYLRDPEVQRILKEGLS